MARAIHRGQHDAAARKLTARARALDDAGRTVMCWRCWLPLDQHPPHATGKPLHWQAGHVDRDKWAEVQRRTITAWSNGWLLAPEASKCNVTAGAMQRNHDAGHPAVVVSSRRW